MQTGTQRKSVGLILIMLVMGGCGQRKTPAAHPSATSSASPPPTPFPVSIQAQGLDSTQFDAQGRIVAHILAEAGAAGPVAVPVTGTMAGSGVNAATTSGASADLAGTLRAAHATLYQNGKPTATLQADTLRADRATRILVGTGNVTLRSLTQSDSPTIRADTMTWRYDANTVTGKGNVVITRNPGLRIPATAFTADTQIKKFTFAGGDGPATGNL